MVYSMQSNKEIFIAIINIISVGFVHDCIVFNALEEMCMAAYSKETCQYSKCKKKKKKFGSHLKYELIGLRK